MDSNVLYARIGSANIDIHPRKGVPGENESYTNVLAKKHQYADFNIKNHGQIYKVIFCENKPLGSYG